MSKYVAYMTNLQNDGIELKQGSFSYRLNIFVMSSCLFR